MKKEKGVIVSFRVDRHLARALNKVPDKSAFIRDVILRSFYETCPLCRGRGVVPDEVSKWAVRRLKTDKALECTCCRYVYPRSPGKRKTSASTRDRFVCPHCQTHDHRH